MKKRALSFILVLVMILSVFPTSSFALSKTYKGVTVDYGTATYKNQVITYIKDGTLTLNGALTAQVILVGGGGSGSIGQKGATSGDICKGSGGTGGSVLMKNVVLEAGTYSITVGAGGAAVTAVTSGKAPGKSGSSSSILGPGINLIAAGGIGGGTETVATAGAGTGANLDFSGTSTVYGNGGAAATSKTTGGRNGANETGNGGGGSGSSASGGKSGAGGNGVVAIILTGHKHIYEYNVSGSNSAVLTANCSSSDSSLSLTLLDGGQLNASELEAWTAAGLDSPVFSFYSQSDLTHPLSSAPSAPGDYVVKATVGSGSNTATASKAYTIIGTHAHKVGSSVVDFTGVAGLTNTAGNYYLTQDIKLSKDLIITKKVTLCLNGHVLDLNGKQIIVNNGGDLQICDCGTTEHYFTEATLHSENAKADIPYWDLQSAKDSNTKHTVTGGVITGGAQVSSSENVFGGAIYADGGSCTLYSGTIAGNYCYYSGTGSKLPWGGAVYLTNNATFTMYGGKVVGNAVVSNGTGQSSGGAVYIYGEGETCGKAFVYGGEICYNAASSYAGGIYAVRGPLTVGGTAKIRYNKAYYQGYLDNGDTECNVQTATYASAGYNGSLEFGTGENAPAAGMSVGIRKNDEKNLVSTDADDYTRYLSSDNNGLYLLYDSNTRVIKLGSKSESGIHAINLFTEGEGVVYSEPQAAKKDTEISLTLTPSDGYELSSLTVTDANGGTVTVTDNKFTMPDLDVDVKAVFIAKPNHTHDFSYSASENTVTAVCADTDGQCDLTDKKIVLTLTATSGTYDGTTSFPASTDDTTVGFTSITGSTLEAVQYQKKTAENTWADPTTTPPVDAGTYKASVKVTDNTDSVTAEQEFIVKKATQVITADDPQAFTYGDTGKSIVASALDNATLTYAVKSGDTVEIDATTGELTILRAGDTTVTVTAAETDNYLSATKDITVSIAKKQIDKPTADTNSFTYTGSLQTYAPVGFDSTLMAIEGHQQTDVSATGYTATVTLADPDNYEWSTAGDCAFPWNIAKADYTGVKTATGEIKAMQGSTVEITLPELPEGAVCGTPTTAFTYVETPVVDNGKLKLTVGSTGIPAGTSAFTVDIPVTDAKNYKEYTVTATVTPTYHDHEFIYSASGNVVTATCADTDGQCDLTDKKIVLTLTATSGTYDGTTSFPATTDDATVGFSSITGSTLGTIQYQKKTAENTWADPTTTPPVDAGTYKASVKVTDNGASVTAEQEFTVKQITTVITAAPSAGTITYGQNLGNSLLTGGEANTAGTFVWTDETILPKVADSKLTEYEVTFVPDDEINYDPCTCKVTLPVLPKEIVVASGITAIDREYIANDVTVTLDMSSAVLEGIIDGDELSATATGTMADDTVGENKTVTIADLALAGTDKANYILAASGHQTVTTVNITELASSVKTAPEAKSLTYTGIEQELVTPGEAENGTVSYTVSKDSTTAPTDPAVWSTTVPTATEEGTYYVWYKSVGDTGYADTVPVCVTVVIAKLNVPVTEIQLSAESLTMMPEDQAKLEAKVLPVNATDPTLTWSTDDDEIITVQPDGSISALKPGNATVTVMATNGVYATCTVTVKPFEYMIIRGAGQIIPQDAPSALFASNADYSKFVSVEVDGKTVDESFYDSYSGSTVVVLKPAFIKNLKVGKHTFVIISRDGSASTTFTVKAPMPPTGDSTPLTVLSLMLLGSLGTVIFLLKKQRKHN